MLTMDTVRRHRIPILLLALVLTGMGTTVVAAQQFPEHPAQEPEMLDIPETDNPQLAARNALMQGRTALKNAEKYLAKASEVEGKKREKLESRAARSYESAAEQFLTAIRFDKELAEAYAGLGQAWLETDQAEKALPAWGMAQKLEPKNPDALFGLGRCLVELDRPRDAASVYMNLAGNDEEKATELLGLLKAWGQPRADDGDDEARKLLDWIAEQQKG